MGWHVPPCGMTSGAAAAGYGACHLASRAVIPVLICHPVIPRPIASGDVVIPPVIPITNVFGLCGARQGDVVTMRRDGERNTNSECVWGYRRDDAFNMCGLVRIMGNTLSIAN